jgi:hypothetical protein
MRKIDEKEIYNCYYVDFGVLMVVTMKNIVLCDLKT